ncbi:MAG TPA: hypothetical protein EYG79_02415 [Rhodobacteraceae bacterium]|nr:hypothetical protein [Paracoccaceae bacterium]
MTKTPVIAQKAPYATDVEGGENYFWCACVPSKNQPLCDGTHIKTIAWVKTSGQPEYRVGRFPVPLVAIFHREKARPATCIVYHQEAHRYDCKNTPAGT